MALTFYILSVVLQAVALAYALWLTIRADRKAPWLMLTLAYGLMLGLRLLRALNLWAYATPPENLFDGIDAAGVSGLLLVAMVFIHAAVMERQVSLKALLSAKDAAEHANQAKDRFLAVLSHELRTPLTPVLAAVEVLAADPALPKPFDDDIQLIRRNVELEARLIDDLLDLTRVSQGKLQLQLATLDVHKVLGYVLEICASDIKAKAIALQLELNAAKHFVRGDSTRLQQACWNLLKNAIKFTPEGGRIVIRSCSEENIEIEITDTGIGIDPPIIPTLFDAFEQGDPNIARRFGGLGLGLAITKALIELHGGTVRATSRGKGQGASFFITLPVVDAAAVAAQGARHADDRVRSLRILLVEDHADTSQTMARLLRSLGHLVKTANNVRDALNMSAVEDFDLIISDIGLPDGTGLEFMEKLRRQKNTPAIALSGYGMDEDIRRSRAAGFSAHLTKPINFEKLEMAIYQVVQQQEAAQPAEDAKAAV